MFELIKNNTRLSNIDSLLDSLINDTVHNNNYLNYYYSDDESYYYIDLALPGFDKKEINLNINGDFLYLNFESENKKTNKFWNKSFKQRYRLPKNINSDNIEAELKNGILSIKIQKDKEESNFKTINIK
ncbi:MAG: hypothetical protein CMP49_06140 [Flavobacteriales bacterium]|nr:hypothetical protein [Flavobacteriales bacterium]|tara:strand:- start:139 stop:525 length:387 start_codon:yes stop_codon:yes gene_type:complete